MGGETFTQSYRVRVDDINYGGHMGNERALVVFQDARIAFLGSLGWSETDVGEGLGLILVEAAVRYAKEVFRNDLLETRVRIANLKRSSFDMEFSSFRIPEGEEAFSGFTRMLVFHYGERKVRELPERVREALARFAG